MSVLFAEVLGELPVKPERLVAQRLFAPGELFQAFDGHRSGQLEPAILEHRRHLRLADSGSFSGFRKPKDLPVKIASRLTTAEPHTNPRRPDASDEIVWISIALPL